VSARIEPAKQRSAARGFTLLEILIAMVVLSIGMLGVAALQGVGLRSNHGAYLTSQASLLAYDMADRIRANPDEFLSYNGYVSSCPDPLPTTPLVTADLAEWGCAVEAILPGGAGRITGEQFNVGQPIGEMTRYTITVEWEDLQVEGDDPWDFVLVIEV
jgi:type IV pilus assembly protein PilV